MPVGFRVNDWAILRDSCFFLESEWGEWLGNWPGLILLVQVWWLWASKSIMPWLEHLWSWTFCVLRCSYWIYQWATWSASPSIWPFLDGTPPNLFIWSCFKVALLGFGAMASLCRWLPSDDWDFSTWKGLFSRHFCEHFLELIGRPSESGLPVLSCGLIKVVYDFRFPRLELVFIDSFSLAVMIWVLPMAFY